MDSSATAVAAERRSASHLAWRHFISWRYAVCLLTLAVLATSMQWLVQQGELHFRKQPVPLKQSLKLFQRSALLPQYELAPQAPPRIDPDTEQSLGTTEHVTLWIHDRNKPASDPTSFASVFITYYTGKPDMVPHVPDECYLAGGFDRINTPFTARVPAVGVHGEDADVPVRVIQFRSRSGRLGAVQSSGAELTVMYFFLVNDSYATTRNEVRAMLGGPFQRFAYYAKFEVRFMSRDGRGATADADASLAALEPLLDKLLPILFTEHFQTLDDAAAGALESPSSPA